MKRLLLISLIALVASVAGGASIGVSTAHAAVGATCATAADCSATEFCDVSTFPATCQLTPAAGPLAPVPPATPPVTGLTPAQQTAAAQTPAPFTGDTTDSSYNWIMIKIMQLFAWLVGVAMVTLNYAVYYTVVVMGNYIKNLTAVGVTWRILRDIGNIALIFGFLAIGISLILNTERIGYGKKMLPTLLVAAIFLNFSLFITEAVIDVGNLFATQFYTQISGGTLPTVTTLTNEGISGTIMSQLGLQTIYGNVQQTSQAQAILKNGNPWLIGFMGVILFIVLAFVLFSLAFILIARFIILLFLIIIAPIGIAGLAVPKLEGTANWWWSELFGQTITAPVLLLLLYIALAVITDVNFLTGFNSQPNQNANWLGSVTNSLGGFAPVFLSFVVAMGLLLAVVMVSKRMSAFGAGVATKWAGALSFGVTAYGASALLNSSAAYTRRKLQQYAPNSRAARIATRGLRYAENARLDIRSLPGVGAGLKKMSADEAARPIEKSKTGFGYAQYRNVKESIKETLKGNSPSDRQWDKETRIPRLQAAATAGNHTEVAKHLGNMSDADLESGEIQNMLADSKQGPILAAAMSKAKFDKLVASDNLSDAQKTNLKEFRNTGFINRFTDTTPFKDAEGKPLSNPVVRMKTPNVDLTLGAKAVQDLSPEAVTQLPDAILREPAVYENLTLQQLNAIYKADKIEDSTAKTIGAFIREDHRPFDSYYNGLVSQQAKDKLNDFWHLGFNTGKSGTTPPTGYQQNPGGRILVPDGGNSSRPSTPPPSANQGPSIIVS